MKITPVTAWRQQRKDTHLIGLKGQIKLWTMIRVPVKEFMQQAPYPVVIAEFGNKTKMTLQLVDYKESDLKIGREIQTVLRRVYTDDDQDIIAYTIKCKPV